MQQLQHVFTARESGALLGVNQSTITRAVQRGELSAIKSRAHAAFQIDRDVLLAWAADKGYRVQGANGAEIDPQTGEVLEPEPTPIAAATAARARLAGVETAARESVEANYPNGFFPAPAAPEPRAESNVARVVLPSAEAGLLEACRRLAALPESPQLWEALRAVLGVEAPAN